MLLPQQHVRVDLVSMATTLGGRTTIALALAPSVNTIEMVGALTQTNVEYGVWGVLKRVASAPWFRQLPLPQVSIVIFDKRLFPNPLFLIIVV